MAIPNDYNIKKKATEEIREYVDLQTEYQRMWNKKVEVIPIITGATGVVEKNIQKQQQQITGQHNIYNLPETSNCWKSSHPEEGIVNQARLSNRTKQPAM